MQRDLAQYLKTHAALIHQHLSSLIPEERGVRRELSSAARYSLLGNGKRLRPILVLATTETLQGNLEAALYPASAIEMIHTYSLIHDDLPCMDNDDFRRGQPTLHKVYNEGHAVLTGDYLLTHAFELLSKAPGLTAEQKIALISSLAKYAGGDGLITGQVLDIASTGKQISLDDLKTIHLKKTASLITAAIEFGGIVANATEQQMHLLTQFGQTVGLAFQIVDDILDVTSSYEKHGKAIASDISNQKVTYVSFLGLEQSQAITQSLLNQSIELLRALKLESSLLESLAYCLVKRNK